MAGNFPFEDLPVFENAPSNLLNKSISAYGGSGRGKSWVIRHVMHSLRNDIGTAIVFCPSNLSHGFYDAIVSDAYIHTNIDAARVGQVLRGVIDMQNVRMAGYAKTLRPGALQSAFLAFRSGGDHQVRVERYIEGYARLLASYEKAGDGDRAARLRVNHERMLEKMYRKSLAELKPEELGDLGTEDDRIVAQNAGLNPHTLVVLDDCTSIYEDLKRDPVLKELFYQGRHKLITLLYSIHSYSAFPPALRKNCHVNFFTDESLAIEYLQECYKELAKEKNPMRAKLRSIYVDAPRFTCAVITESTLYRFRAEAKTDFVMGDRAVRSYSAAITTGNLSGRHD